MDYLYILGTVFFTTYGQLVLKWQIAASGALPVDFVGKLLFLMRLFKNFWVVSAFVCALLAALCWMAALSKFELSYAYPFMSLSFVIVLVLSNMFFNEPINAAKVFGIILIVVGITIGSKG
jgi:multidrug transporter EmrE-like cation transporter